MFLADFCSIKRGWDDAKFRFVTGLVAELLICPTYMSWLDSDTGDLLLMVKKQESRSLVEGRYKTLRMSGPGFLHHQQ